jgi:hypothetical protein
MSIYITFLLDSACVHIHDLRLLQHPMEGQLMNGESDRIRKEAESRWRD